MQQPYYNTHNSYTTPVEKKYHKVGVGRNHSDNTPPSFLKLSAQNIFFTHSGELHLKQWAHWLSKKNLWIPRCTCKAKFIFKEILFSI
jgi:hypothetical protein